MQWELSTAKNGEQTLALNNVQLYSRYRPREDAWKWIDAQFEVDKSSYLLIGLGLGYHAERLKELAGEKPVYVYFFDQEEYTRTPIQEAVSQIDHIDLEDCQILIPNPWIKALGDHPLIPHLETIKINQQSYKRFSPMLAQNFEENIKWWSYKAYPAYKKKIACLVASGPSLNETINWLKNKRSQVDIFVVGSSLKMLLQYGIEPAAVVISDAQPRILHQIKGAEYKGDLYFLSTANSGAVKEHKGSSYMLFQQGYPDAEISARQYNLPILETGGSVSTTAISLLEHLGFEQVILFGQDMGFTDERTHAELSTSGRKVTQDVNLREVTANDGSTIYTKPNLQVYAKWIDEKAKRTQMKIYTTSAKGLKLKNVNYINETQFSRKVSE